jgi:hypothetical protein
MNLADLLAKAAGIPVDVLKALIDAGIKAAPDLADEGAKLKAWIDSSASPEALVALGAVIFSEGKNIAAGKLDPRSHASDAA